MNTKPLHYVNNDALYKDMIENWYPAILKWKEDGKPGDPPPATEFMGKSILAIAERYCYSKNFYFLKNMHDDLKMHACLVVLKYLHNFDPEKSKNPFAYITMITHHAFFNYIKGDTKNNRAKSAVVDQMFFEQMQMDLEQGGENFITFLKDKIEQDALEDEKFDRAKEEFEA